MREVLGWIGRTKVCMARHWLTEFDIDLWYLTVKLKIRQTSGGKVTIADPFGVRRSQHEVRVTRSI